MCACGLTLGYVVAQRVHEVDGGVEVGLLLDQLLLQLLGFGEVKKVFQLPGFCVGKP